ncbi:MAG: tetratricopeptide repeat protein [Bacteroidetes bacterium]|jgi:tetratricopeptide (TPR) repeat protein|nr:tetratricopeptide repeat protein [Bacteroidota bacterium]HQW46155.1 tetratricopeptide repeat protein [Chitinophagaceae bacterium]MBK7039405.1 tetratricopeptide repeat protein [Bacteroidota bacterium]MBK7589445.1 tetratricopeptide repeat protein [Bacteroidota bacterium]MBK8328091.1 tetratricopeptide repeat protein [Bacteroidota bacterium]
MAKQDLYTAPRKVVATNVIDNEPSAEEKLKGVEHWYQNNSKLINNVLIGILAVVAGIFAYTRFYKAPKIQKSNDAIFRAQTYFGIDSINWALNGDGSNLGFLKIIDKYSGTPAANLSQYYAGICYLKMGDFAKAEKHLKSFDGKGTMVSYVAKGALGDAYMEQNKTAEAISAYLEAGADENNILLTPVYLERAGMAYEMQNKKEDAIKTYKKIVEKFPSSPQSQNIKKSLARLGEYN